MHQSFACLLLLLSLPATFSKYVYIRKLRSWHDAQSYCREHHTDLAPVNDERDIRKLQNRAGWLDNFWIGLVRNSTDPQKWMWSGGGKVTTFFWAWGQPENREGEDYGVMFFDAWHDARGDETKHFFCFKAIVVRERKTWLEALEYCREHHRNLASVGSETEMLLIKKELEKNETTEHVWIGLHFFPGGWMWVDGQSQCYKAWSPQGKLECPEIRMECAALKVGGHGLGSNSSNPQNMSTASTSVDNSNTDSRGGTIARTSVDNSIIDSHEATFVDISVDNSDIESNEVAIVDISVDNSNIDSNEVAITGISVDNSNTGSHAGTTGASTGQNTSGGSDAAADEEKIVWEAHDCEERLHFVCY